MNETPQFLEFSVPCRDIAESLAWYQQLGFTELFTGDMRTAQYAVVTDGDFCIGLYDNGYPAPGLSFVQFNVSARVRREQSAGMPFAFARLGEDEFHEAALTDPDGTLAVLLEARTFSGAVESVATPMTGRLNHVSLPCISVQNSIDFWQDFGFIAVTSDEENRTELHTPGLLVELVPGTRSVELHFKANSRTDCIRQIEREHALKETPAGYKLTTPEGIHLVIS